MNFFQMTDEEFINYLKNKYGSNWQFISLTLEEFRRCPTITEEEIKEALEKGKQEAEKARNNF